MLLNKFNIFKLIGLITISTCFISSCEQMEEDLPPVACFEIPNNQVYANQPVTFTSCSENAKAVYWKFDSNSDEFAPGTIVEHTYLNPGTYTVEMVVYNKTMRASKQDQITVLKPVEPGEVMVITKEVTIITESSATTGGIVTYNSVNITERGICWSKSSEPTISDATITSSEDDFDVEISDLESATEYYVRAYAISDNGNATYGEELSFTTLDINSDINITISDAYEIGANSAKIDGSISADESTEIISYGLIWSTNDEFELGDDGIGVQNYGAGTGDFVGELTELLSETTYYAKVYATTADQYFYSETKEFFTRPDIVTINPAIFTADDEITITFNAKGGDAGLQGYNGDVYAHIGLNTSAGDWQYTIADWSENNDKVKMVRLSDDYYVIKIRPSIREFFGVTNSSEVINQIAIVFRSADGTLSARNPDGSDIFIDVTGGTTSDVVVFDPKDYVGQSLPTGMQIVQIEEEYYIKVELNQYNASIEIDPVRNLEGAGISANIRYEMSAENETQWGYESVQNVVQLLDHENTTVVEWSEEPVDAFTGLVQIPSNNNFGIRHADIHPDMKNCHAIQFFAQETVEFRFALDGDFIWCGKIVATW